ncbi:MAG TPA: hypothetical protein VK324_03420, partial [Tepidisphaeraceae bacterium]|nr:hypothetical protein [Tepidisphaeraceae bacterium]
YAGEGGFDIGPAAPRSSARPVMADGPGLPPVTLADPGVAGGATWAGGPGDGYLASSLGGGDDTLLDPGTFAGGGDFSGLSAPGGPVPFGLPGQGGTPVPRTPLEIEAARNGLGLSPGTLRAAMNDPFFAASGRLNLARTGNPWEDGQSSPDSNAAARAVVAARLARNGGFLDAQQAAAERQAAAAQPQQVWQADDRPAHIIQRDARYWRLVENYQAGRVPEPAMRAAQLLQENDYAFWASLGAGVRHATPELISAWAGIRGNSASSTMASRSMGMSRPAPRGAVPGFESPYFIRINPNVSGRPDPQWSIDTGAYRSGIPTPNGGMRNRVQFWQDWLTLRPETISASNRYLIRQLQTNPRGPGPRVDSIWTKHFPEQQPFVKAPIVHHHVNQGPIAIPVAQPTHMGRNAEWHGR